MENKRTRTAATMASKPRSSKQRIVEPTQKPETFNFRLDEIQSIEIKAMAVVVPKPPPRTMALRMSNPSRPQSPPPPPPPPIPQFTVCIVVVPKPPPG